MLLKKDFLNEQCKSTFYHDHILNKMILFHFVEIFIYSFPKQLINKKMKYIGDLLQDDSSNSSQTYVYSI